MSWGPASSLDQQRRGRRRRRGCPPADIAAACRLVTASAYTRLDRLLPLLLAATAHNTEQGPAGAARTADVWVLASHLAVKQNGTEAVGAYGGRVGAAPRRSGNPVVLAVALYQQLLTSTRELVVSMCRWKARVLELAALTAPGEKGSGAGRLDGPARGAYFFRSGPSRRLAGGPSRIRAAPTAGR
ncbi:hypothetical protein ACFVY4_34405 [Streptomyces sp. NPDC058299]|uniref:hypothetical protein n=1 Tax=Streptomyces sp. NPDC058299 TaxID=3346435 RepID=UPI0036E6246C